MHYNGAGLLGGRESRFVGLLGPFGWCLGLFGDHLPTLQRLFQQARPVLLQL